MVRRLTLPGVARVIAEFSGIVDETEGSDWRVTLVACDALATAKKANSRSNTACTGSCSRVADLAAITRNTIVPAIPSAPGWDQDTEPAPLQKKILDLLGSLTDQQPAAGSSKYPQTLY